MQKGKTQSMKHLEKSCSESKIQTGCIHYKVRDLHQWEGLYSLRVMSAYRVQHVLLFRSLFFIIYILIIEEYILLIINQSY